MEAEIIKLCTELKHSNHCPGCGGNIENGTCAFCGRPNEKSVELIRSLEALLHSETYPLEALMELVNIYDLKIPFVNAIVDAKKDSISMALAFLQEQNRYDETINMLSKDNSDMVLNPNCFYGIAREYLSGDIKMEEGSFIQFMKLYVKKILESGNFKSLYQKTPTVKFATTDEMDRVHKASEDTIVHGLCAKSPTGDTVYLHDQSFLTRRNSEPHENVVTIYHELQHLIQPSYYKTPERFNLIGLMMAKEEAIRNIIPNYKDENYEHMAVELDANANAYMALASDLESLGLDPLNYRGIAEVLFDKILDTRRTLNGEETTLDNLFDTLVKDPEVLNAYPILELQYKNIDGNIVKKSLEELQTELNGTTNPKLKVIYEYLMGNIEFTPSTR